MSSTNKSFIKAYRHDGRQSQTVEPPTSVDAIRSHALATNRADGPRIAAASAASPSGATSRGVGSAEKRPLSSFIAGPQPGQTLRVEPPEQGSTFRAGTTVASFQWPAVCRALMQKCGPQLDQVARLLWARARAGNSLIGVFGLFIGSGATATALSLASRAASSGRRVIVGDGNFRNPQMATLLEAVPTAGWEEVLKHSAPLPDAVIHATHENLDLLALGSKLLSDPLTAVGGLQAAVTAGILRHSYDLSILDLGAFFDPVSQPIFLELVSNLGVDAAVAVAGPDPADRRDLATITEQLDRTGCEFLGVIENRIALRAA